MKEKFDNFYSDCDYDHRGDCDREYGLYSDFECEVWILLAAIQDDCRTFYFQCAVFVLVQLNNSLDNMLFIL